MGTLRFGAFLLALSMAAAGPPAGARPQDAGPHIVFVKPVDKGYYSGRETVAVRIAPAGTAVKSVSLFADGALLCTLERPPFQCPWSAGPGVVEHLVRATAVLADGRKIQASVRTQGTEFTDTVDVDAIRVTATVTGRGNRFIRDLKAADFRIYEDGSPRPITAFVSDDIDLEIIVAVDVSGSMTKAMPTVKAAVKKFLTKLRPQDVVTVMSFNDRPYIIARPAASLEDRLKAVDRLRPWGGTSLYDTMLKALSQLGTQQGRQVIVVFTDGEDRDSRVPIETAERNLESNDALLYAIGLGRAPDMADLRKVLERISEKSGGRAFFEDLDKLDEVFGDIITDLSNQYLLMFRPRDERHDGRWREIRVDVPGQDYKIRHKKGYRLAPK
jgi:VWFA-related protein